MPKKKQPKNVQTPTPRKKATHLENPKGYQNQFVAWHFRSMDNGGDWPCDCRIIGGLIPLLAAYENMTWNEATSRHHTHPISVKGLCDKAKNRLIKIGFEDAETLYQFEMSGKGARRLWGLRIQNILQILWWDPKHTVYPIRRR